MQGMRLDDTQKSMRQDIESYVGKQIVVDTCSNWIYLGTLNQVSDTSLVLTDADAHDISDTDVSKEFYIFDSKTTGIKANRKQVFISLDFVVGFSAMEDIKEF